MAILAFAKGMSRSVQVQLNGIEAVMVLTVIILKHRALLGLLRKNQKKFGIAKNLQERWLW